MVKLSDVKNSLSIYTWEKVQELLSKSHFYVQDTVNLDISKQVSESIIRRTLSERLARFMKHKINIVPIDEEEISGFNTYRSDVYIFTEEELINLVKLLTIGLVEDSNP